MDFTRVKKNLIERGYRVSCFDTAKEALDYLDSEIDAQSVGMGGSITLEELGIYEPLSKHNSVFWHQRIPKDKTPNEVRRDAASASVYISSVNAISENGEIINIDGVGNRVASIFYGHERVYLVAGKNKLAGDYEGALWRARNIAAPKNARRLGMNTPCAKGELRCHDCRSKDRICKGLFVLWGAPMRSLVEVVLISEELGY